MTITLFEENPFTWIDRVGMELALQFMEKVGRIKETRIDFQLMDRYEVQSNEESNMTKYFKLLNAF